MTARLRPTQPVFATASEGEAWAKLVEQAPDEWTILANLRLTDEKKDWEFDLVVLMPDVGVIVGEVKGGNVSVSDGEWRTSTSRDGTRVIHPVDQARDGKHALWGYVRSDPRWKGSSRTRVRFGHTVITPRTTIHEDFATPDCPRWMIHGKNDLDDLAGRLWDITAKQESGFRAPTEADCDLIAEILLGRNLPQRTLLAEADERESRADRLTLEQAAILGATRLIPRLEVRGGAGSGKTVLATTQAKELTRGGNGRPGQRVALLCYSLGLASWFRRLMETVDRKHRPAFCGTFEDLARYVGVEEFGGRDEPDFWEERLPQRMLELASSLPDGKKFDAVVVDEAQDFADLWWAPIMRSLRDEETGGLYVYSDENQRVFQRFGVPPVPLVPLVLDHNLRNTKQIADTFGPLTPMRMRARGGDGPEVTFIPTLLDDALDVADDAVEALLEDWRPEDVALLTTGARHDEQVSRQEVLGQDGYWDTFWDTDQVFYGHVLGFKGLERRCVVLCANEASVKDRSRERLYVGLSRATDKLVVVGPPELIREIGGPEVAKRLGVGIA